MSIPEGLTVASAGIRPVTVAIHEDEPAFMLVELNLVRPHQEGTIERSWRRWQVVTVNRDDKLADWWHDLGPASNYPDGPPLCIPGLWEESVAALRDLAEQRRNSHVFAAQKAELEAESTLIPDMVTQFDEGKRIMRNVSVFGPGVSRQRNGLDQRAFDELCGRS